MEHPVKEVAHARIALAIILSTTFNFILQITTIIEPMRPMNVDDLKIVPLRINSLSCPRMITNNNILPKQSESPSKQLIEISSEDQIG